MGSKGDVSVLFGERLTMTGPSLQAPLTWLRDAGVAVTEVRTDDLRSEQLQTALYSAAQVIFTISYSTLFSPAQAPRLSALAATLNTFQHRRGVKLVVGHHGQLTSPSQLSAANESIQRWLHTATSQSAERRGDSDVDVEFIDLNKAKEAQISLRGAMGFKSDGPSSAAQAGDSRSHLWTRFQELSTDSGLPALMSSLSLPTEQAPKIGMEPADLLHEHALQYVASRLAVAEAELEEMRSLSSWLASSSTDGAAALTDEIVSSVSKAVVQQPKAVGSNEPPLLPSWWKLPWLGDAEVRERVQRKLEREWLGGSEVEDRLTWWGGRLVEFEKQERSQLHQIVQRLLKGQHLPSFPPNQGTSDEPPQSASESIRTRTVSRALSLPPSLLLALRAAFTPLSASHSNGVQFSDVDVVSNPSLLAQPVAQTRSHLLGRRGSSRMARGFSARVAPGTTMTGTATTDPATASTAPSGASLLDELQRRVQASVYRFWTTISLSYGLPAWASVSHTLFHQQATNVLEAAPVTSPDPPSLLLEVLSYPQMDTSTAAAVALFGTTFALWSLQRSHARLAKKFLSRDVLERMPQIALAEIRALSDAVCRNVVFKSRADVARVLKQWVDSNDGIAAPAEAGSQRISPGRETIASQKKRLARIVAAHSCRTAA
ncbi:unnamed protein product [Parajaminaea phylloscopi]